MRAVATGTIISLVLGLAARADAQSIPFSQHALVSQRVAYTDLTIEYNRPTARGRVLFGDSGSVVRVGRSWNPGADSATHLTVSRNVMIEGQPLKQGTYSIWLIPQASGPWTLILNSAARVFHTPYPGERSDVLRVQVMPERGDHMEALAFYFPVVGRDSTVLRLHWGTTIIPVQVRVSREP